MASPNMKKPPFPTRDEIANLFDWDIEQGLLLHKDGSDPTYSQGQGYRYVCVRGYGFLLHRVIWMLATGAEPSGMLDHINGIRDDNRLSNLREATCAQNVRNKRVNKSSRSGVKGVRFDLDRGKWRASICGQYLGRFTTCAEAAEAYRTAAVANFGEFARTNL